MYNLTFITLIPLLFLVGAINPSYPINVPLVNHANCLPVTDPSITLNQMLALLKKGNPGLNIKKGKQVNGRTLYYANEGFKTVVQLYTIQDSLKQLKLAIIMDAKDPQTSLRINKVNNIISKIAEAKVQHWVNDELKNIQKSPDKNHKYQLRTSKYATYEINYEAKLRQLSFNLYQ